MLEEGEKGMLWRFGATQILGKSYREVING